MLFEKESEIYALSNFGFRGKNSQRVLTAKIDYQQGAEFGYNKAKEEWKKHFLQCSSPFCLDNFSEVKCYGELGNMTKKESE